MLLKLTILWCVVLLLVQKCSGQGSSDVSAKCDMNSDSDNPNVPRTYYQMQCNQIKKPEDVQQLKKKFERQKFAVGLPITIIFMASNLDLLSPELFTAYNVTNVMLLDCYMSHLPYDLFCTEKVSLAALVNTPIPGSELTQGGFQGCNKLRYLTLQNTSLATIPPGSFRGLDSLTELRILNNRIVDVPDLSGLEHSLKTLILGFNPIKFVSKNAFHNLGKVTELNLMNASITGIEVGSFDGLAPDASVVVAGNPLHCDCSLKWLQGWLKQHPLKGPQMESYGTPSCATPMAGPLMAIDFCNTSTTAALADETKPQTDGTVHQTGNMWKICSLALLLIIFLNA